jgi:hypothetical protein
LKTLYEMKITRDNCEQYFLDFAEGNLSHEMEKDLSDFLEANPDLKPILEEFDPSPLQTADLNNANLKAKLRKHLTLTEHIGEDNIDEWMIRDIEGLLGASEEKELAEFLSLNPAYRFDYKLFGFTRLSPDLSVTFRQKMNLKKKVVHFQTSRLMWLLPAAAAIVLLFFGIRYFNQPPINAVHPMVPTIAEVPLISTPGIVAGSITSLSVVKKIPVNGTPSLVRIQPILAKQIIADRVEALPINLAESDLYPIMAFEKKDRSLIGKVFNNMLAQARDGLGNRPKLEKAGKSDFSFWSVAKAGINGFNSMSDRDLELYLRKDESGKVKSYALVEEERLILSKDLNKN